MLVFFSWYVASQYPFPCTFSCIIQLAIGGNFTHIFPCSSRDKSCKVTSKYLACSRAFSPSLLTEHRLFPVHGLSLPAELHVVPASVVLGKFRSTFFLQVSNISAFSSKFACVCVTYSSLSLFPLFLIMHCFILLLGYTFATLQHFSF